MSTRSRSDRIADCTARLRNDELSIPVPETTFRQMKHAHRRRKEVLAKPFEVTERQMMEVTDLNKRKCLHRDRVQCPKGHHFDEENEFEHAYCEDHYSQYPKISPEEALKAKYKDDMIKINEQLHEKDVKDTNYVIADLFDARRTCINSHILSNNQVLPEAQQDKIARIEVATWMIKTSLKAAMELVNLRADGVLNRNTDGQVNWNQLESEEEYYQRIVNEQATAMVEQVKHNIAAEQQQLFEQAVAERLQILVNEMKVREEAPLSQAPSNQLHAMDVNHSGLSPDLNMVTTKQLTPNSMDIDEVLDL